jgi:hypothetical protein
MLVWIPAKQYFVCPCGNTKVTEFGQPVGMKARMKFGSGRPKKGARRGYVSRDGFGDEIYD